MIFDTAQTELFAEDAVNIEAYATPDFEKETKGLKEIREKGVKWNTMMKEMHSLVVSDPLIAANSFGCTMRMDVAMKVHGRIDMTELCVCQVEMGK